MVIGWIGHPQPTLETPADRLRKESGVRVPVVVMVVMMVRSSEADARSERHSEAEQQKFFHRWPPNKAWTGNGTAGISKHVNGPMTTFRAHIRLNGHPVKP
jgi:hypothetical protein